MDPKIKAAIEMAVSEAAQSQGLARKITRWFEAIASGNEDITDRQATDRHLELLYDEVQTSSRQVDEAGAKSTNEEESFFEPGVC